MNTKRVVVVIMLCAAICMGAPAQAQALFVLVPAAGLVIWAVSTVAVGTLAVVASDDSVTDSIAENKGKALPRLAESSSLKTLGPQQVQN